MDDTWYILHATQTRKHTKTSKCFIILICIILFFSTISGGRRCYPEEEEPECPLESFMAVQDTATHVNHARILRGHLERVQWFAQYVIP